MEKVAIVTGASSGIGKEMARQLHGRGYRLYLTARSESRLRALADELGNGTEIGCYDLSHEKDIEALVGEIRRLRPAVFINNAGYGLFGDFDRASVEDTKNLVTVNCQALTRLMQAAIPVMEEQGEGYILNVGSVAGLLPAGPHLASYYASKSYVVSLTLGVRRELIERKAPVSLSLLCPGPVDTGFNDRAGVLFAIPGKKPEEVAKTAIDGLFRKKAIIVPGLLIRASAFVGRLLPRRAYAALISRQQKKKGG